MSLMKRALAALAAAFLATAAEAAAFRYFVDLDIAGYEGKEELSGFPLLVRVSEAAVPGFRYADVTAHGGAGAVRFFTEDGEQLPSECEYWNTSGESIFWVRLPSLTPIGTKIRMKWWFYGGGTLEESDSAGVWSDFIGVWHMGDSVDATEALNGKVARDSTAHGLDAVPQRGANGNLSLMVSKDGPVGLARVNQSNNQLKGNQFVVPYDRVMDVGSSFTLSMWLSFTGYDTASPCIVSTKRNKASSEVAEEDTPGWAVSLRKSNYWNQLQLRGSGDLAPYVTVSDSPVRNRGFLRYDLVYSGSRVLVYVNGEKAGEETVNAVASSGAPLRFGNNTNETCSVNGIYDEIRYSKGAMSADWIAADYAQQKAGGGYVSFGTLCAGESLFWSEDPSITPSVWHPGEAATVQVRARALSDGDDVPWRLKFTNLVTGETSDKVPDAIGSYEALFYVPRSSLERSIHVDVINETPVAVTGSDRVLVFSRDVETVPEAPVEDDQTCGNVNPANSVYWKYLNDDEPGEGSQPLLQPGTVFELWTGEAAGEDAGRRLWRFEQCRLGNTFNNKANTGAVDGEQNYLPVSTKASRFNAADRTASQYRHGGAVMLRNTKSAGVYSPCYEDGIGTIYFDAVNGWVAYPNNIVVEVCTGVKPLNAEGNGVVGNIPETDDDGVNLPPTDGNCGYTDEDGIEHPFGRCIWTQVAVHRYVVSGGAIDTYLSGDIEADDADGIPLDCTVGGATDNWFRIRAGALNIRVPARFRIRRLDSGSNYYDASTEASVLDGEGLVILDNLICTMPAATIGLSQFGAYRNDTDPGKDDQSRRALGQVGAFSVAFPSWSETNLVGRAKATYEGYTNIVSNVEGLDIGDGSGMVTTMRMDWRWRRLDQSFSQWEAIYMRPKEGQPEVWETLKPLKITDDDGEPLYGEGDIEYRVQAIVDGPFGVFADYTDLAVGVGGYSERIGTVDCENGGSYNTLVGTYGIVKDSTFVRLREGASAYEGIDLWIQDGTSEVRFPMELVGDRQWRGFYPTTNDTEKTVKFWFEGRARQEDGALVYNADSVGLFCTKDVESVPVNLTVEEEGGVERELAIPAKPTANYMVFLLNEKVRTLSIANADRQNFDYWSASRRETPDKFYTSFYETNSTATIHSRIPESEDDNCIEYFTLSSATNKNWRESFSLSGGQSAVGYPIGESFRTETTPESAWTAEFGAWAPQKYGVTNATDFALEMKGQTLGTLIYSRNSDLDHEAPNGLESISFKARLSQLMRYQDISYSNYGLVDNTTLTNCTIAAQVAVDPTVGLDGFDGDGSISLVLGYMPGQGCYEYRVTIDNVVSNAFVQDSTQALTARCRHAIYKWYYDENDDEYVAKELYSTFGDATWGTGNGAAWCWKANVGDDSTGRSKIGSQLHMCMGGDGYSGMFFSISNGLNRVYLTGGVTGGSDNKSAGAEAFTYENKDFCIIAVEDHIGDDGSPIWNKGTYGYITKNCPAQILYPRVYERTSVAPLDTARAEAGGLYWTTNVPLIAESGYHAARTDDMVFHPRRLVPYSYNELWGYAADTNAYQTVDVYIQPINGGVEGNWSLVTKELVSSFRLAPFRLDLQLAQTCNVKFQTGDSSTAIVIDEATLSQWCGSSGSQDGYGEAYARDPDTFCYYVSWISNKVVRSQSGTTRKKVAVLAPRRASSARSALAVRSPFMEGLGSVTFSYEDAYPGAQVLVQWCACDYMSMGDKSFEPADSPDWETIASFTFDASERKGTRTVHLGKRAPVTGAFRVAIPQDVVAQALEDDTLTETPEWMSVSITDMFCIDEPAFDSRSWWGWNFLTTGWNAGSSGEYGSIRDGGLGGVGVLNSTALDESTLETGNSEDYISNNPFFQSPTFTTNWIGEISFRTRAYDGDGPSCLTVWAAREGATTTGEDWIALTNIIVSGREYRRVVVKCMDDDRYAAIRIGVANAEGVTGEFKLDPAAKEDMPDAPTRVVIDDVVVTERGFPEIGFRIDFARPFRLGLSDRTAVEDIDTGTEQPLLDEQFGFQAEVLIGGASEEIDLSITPKVYVSYYPAKEPWGYKNWKDLPEAFLRIELPPAEGTNLVYRSMPENPDTYVMPQPMLDDENYGLVQYFLEVRYWKYGETESDAGHWASINATQWRMPTWDEGFEDPNGVEGAAFSPFTLLDSVSPGRAWINEVNYTAIGDDSYTDQEKQFIEVCFPGGSDMTGWRVYRYRRMSSATDFMKQDFMFMFGADGVPATKQIGESHPVYAFVAVKDPSSSVDEADADWNDEVSSCARTKSYGFQLVRPTGVIEQQIVVQGLHNPNDRNSKYEAGTNVVRVLNELFEDYTEKKWDYVGVDTNVAGRSVGVYQNAGQLLGDWNNWMHFTPGLLNEDQTIPDDWYIPATGMNLWLSVTTGPNVWIVGAGGPVSAASFVVPEGQSTNLVFEVSPWYKLGSLLLDGTTEAIADAVRTAEEASVAGRSVWTYEYVNPGVNKGTVLASAAIDDSVLVRGDLDPDDPYTPAIMDWLLKGSLDGTWEGTEISTNCWHWDIHSSHESGTNVTLKGRYWLDIDPTSDRWDVRTGYTKTAMPIYRPASDGYWPESVTNTRMTVFVMISNKIDNAESYPPYRLQGLGGERSDEVGPFAWTSVTFQVQAALKYNGSSGYIDVSGNFYPLRQFVFDNDSFGAPGSPHPFQASIEILDNRSTTSPGYGYGWTPELTPKGGEDLYWRFRIDERTFRQSPDMLKMVDTWDGGWQ